MLSGCWEKKEPIPVYEVLERKIKQSSEKSGVVENYLKALKLYQRENFADALKEFEKVLTIDQEDGPSQTYKTMWVFWRPLLIKIGMEFIPLEKRMISGLDETTA